MGRAASAGETPRDTSVRASMLAYRPRLHPQRDEEVLPSGVDRPATLRTAPAPAGRLEGRSGWCRPRVADRAHLPGRPHADGRGSAGVSASDGGTRSVGAGSGGGSPCRRCGCQGAPRDSLTRRLAHEPFGGARRRCCSRSPATGAPAAGTCGARTPARLPSRALLSRGGLRRALDDHVGPRPRRPRLEGVLAPERAPLGADRQRPGPIPISHRQDLRALRVHQPADGSGTRYPTAAVPPG